MKKIFNKTLGVIVLGIGAFFVVWGIEFIAAGNMVAGPRYSAEGKNFSGPLLAIVIGLAAVGWG